MEQSAIARARRRRRGGRRRVWNQSSWPCASAFQSASVNAGIGRGDRAERAVHAGVLAAARDDSCSVSQITCVTPALANACSAWRHRQRANPVAEVVVPGLDDHGRAELGAEGV